MVPAAAAAGTAAEPPLQMSHVWRLRNHGRLNNRPFIRQRGEQIGDGVVRRREEHRPFSVLLKDEEWLIGGGRFEAADESTQM